jgi:hypothetical protein
MISPNPRDFPYDIETYPNAFTFAAKHALTGERYMFEHSYRKKEIPLLIEFVLSLQKSKARMVGFNNIYFDYPVIHYILETYFYCGEILSPYAIYEKANSIIHSEDRFGHIVWDNNRYVEQIDLFKIHHFDNKARSTSLKMLEFNMRVQNIEDLPFTPGTFLEPNEIDTLRHYNMYGDVDNTELFYLKSLEMIEFREELSKKYDKNFINFSDKKIGSEILITELEKNNPGVCYEYIDDQRTPRQTPREFINLGDVIFPYVQFSNPEFKRIRDWLASQTIYETNGVFKDLTCTVDGFTYVFGTGGIHGSVESQIVSADDENMIVDLDVKSYYPNIGIKNRAYPEHLGEKFCDIYEGIYIERGKYPKKTHKALNTALKLALNGAYGDSNSVFSVFYDPKYTMTITINGQLMLCMLAEYLRNIPGLQMIQINTDGLTFKCGRKYADVIKNISSFWESITMLELEEARYSRMFIRDVNNYIAEYEDGTLKHKSAYLYDLAWHQNQSSLVIQKAAEAALVRGEDIRNFIVNHKDIMDFMLRAKVPRSSKLGIVTDVPLVGETFHQLQNITRYYISTNGGKLFKIMPPAWKNFYVYDASNVDTSPIVKILSSKDIYHINDANNKLILVPTKAACKILEKHGCVNTENIVRRQGPERKIGINTGWKITPCNNMDNVNAHTIDYEFYIHEAEKLVKPLRGY